MVSPGGSQAAFTDRAVGSVLGLALGDALGAPFEFRRAREIPDPVPAFERPWLGLPPGSTTDDTAMARNLVRSLVEKGRFDPDDLVERHLAWFRTNPPDMGMLTRRVLARADRGAPASEAARAAWEERGPEVSAGNGSVMYCAPLGVAYANAPSELFELAPLLSSQTHWDGRCRTAVLSVCLVTADLVRGRPVAESLHEVVTLVAGLEGGEELEFLIEASGTSRPIDGPDQGFCLYAAAIGLQAALRAARTPGLGAFERELRRVVSLGGDTDTNAAVAGALLGAAVGTEGLPTEWLRRLVDREGIEREARELAALAARRLPSDGS